MPHAGRDYPFYRHGRSHSVSTPLDKYLEVRHWLSYLTAKDFLIDNLRTIHGLTQSDALSRSKKIIPHAHDAIAFLTMADSSPTETAFVPAYYSTLNLVKICILASPLHGQLQSQRYHGARYEVDAKDSHSLMTDVVTVMSGGALAIYYRLLTGTGWGNNRRIKIGDLYSYLTDVSHEYAVATGKEPLQATLQFGLIPAKRKERIRVCLTASPRNGSTQLKARDIISLKGFVPFNNERNHFHSSRTFLRTDPPDKLLDLLFNRQLIYYPDGNKTRVPLTGLKILPVEEIPILLTFFHLSSVARYKPEFLYKITESKFWPMVSAHLRQGLYKYLLLFWSHMNKKTYIVNSD
jgi:hypothetical protein